MFKKGENVSWSSQSRGSTLTKCGEIIYVVKPGESVFQAASVFSGHKIMFDGNLPRKKESYLVSVKTGKTDKAKRSLYWPYVSKLRKLVIFRLQKGL